MTEFSPFLLLLVVSGVCLLITTIVVIWFFMTVVNTEAFMKQIEKLEHGGNRIRAVKLCSAFPRPLVIQYCQFLFSLQIPRKTFRGFGDGFREAAPAVDFEDIVREESERARKHFEKRARNQGATGVVASIVGVGSILAYLTFYGTWPLEGFDAIEWESKLALVLGGLTILVGQYAWRSWYKMVLGLRLVENRLLPVLKAKESMSAEAVEAAESAKKTRVLEPATDGA